MQVGHDLVKRSVLPLLSEIPCCIKLLLLFILLLLLFKGMVCDCHLTNEIIFFLCVFVMKKLKDVTELFELVITQDVRISYECKRQQHIKGTCRAVFWALNATNVLLKIFG